MVDIETDELSVDDLRFGADGLIPAVVQDAKSLEVLMVAYMDREALKRTIETGMTWFWSRSRDTYWMKGESSGNTQEVREIRYDCDADTLLVRVRQQGSGACHTGACSCFYRTLYSSMTDEG